MLPGVQSCSRQAEYALEGQRAAAELLGARTQNERLACSRAQAQAICQASDAQLKDLQRQHRKVTLVSFTLSQRVSKSALDAVQLLSMWGCFTALASLLNNGAFPAAC